jgi:hypothetical protein
VKQVATLRHHRGGSILEVGSDGKNNFALHQISKRHIFAVKTSFFNGQSGNSKPLNVLEWLCSMFVLIHKAKKKK